jgi:nitrogen regulatory protein PII
LRLKEIKGGIMPDRQITYLTDALIITCIVQASHADNVVKAAQNVGAQGATVTYARGTGVRERMGLMGVAIDEQKEMVRIIVSQEQSDRVFEAMYLAGELDKPGMGIMFMNKLDRIATYIPDEVLAEAAEPKAKAKPKAKADPKKRKTATRRPVKKASK